MATVLTRPLIEKIATYCIVCRVYTTTMPYMYGEERTKKALWYPRNTPPWVEKGKVEANVAYHSKGYVSPWQLYAHTHMDVRVTPMCAMLASLWPKNHAALGVSNPRHPWSKGLLATASPKLLRYIPVRSFLQLCLGEQTLVTGLKPLRPVPHTATWTTDSANCSLLPTASLIINLLEVNYQLFFRQSSWAKLLRMAKIVIASHCLETRVRTSVS